MKSPLSRRPRVPRLLRPLVRFLQTEAAGGIVLLACTVIALILANSPWSQDYHDLWHTHLTLSIGDDGLDMPLEWWINDGLMTLFFFVVGLEIKRELVAGELRDPRKAALPAAAALGGMIVPALIYSALIIVPGKAGASGWAIPMATDIAFVVGVLALFGRRVPHGLKIMLLSLAIVDDLGAVVVIAVFYTADLNLSYLALGGGGLLAVILLRVSRVRQIPAYGLVGVGAWLAIQQSGIHPTILGVILGLLTPASERVGRKRLLEVLDYVAGKLRADADNDDLKGAGDEVSALVRTGIETLSPLERLEGALHPLVAFGIMPLFALANAGVAINLDLLGSSISLAVACGLALGKPLGIVLFSFLAVRLGWASLPGGINWRVLCGAACLGGIGFTMALFIARLGLPHDLLDAGKVGVLAGSILSAVLGSVALLRVLPGSNGEEEAGESG